jgi:hypothetical protein
MANTAGSGKGAGYTMQQPSAYGGYGSLGMGNFGMRSDQPQRSVSPFSSKGGGSRSQFNEQLYNLPGFSDSLQSSQQRMAQDPNANMMRTQPGMPIGMPITAQTGQLGQPQTAQPQTLSTSGWKPQRMSIDDFARSVQMGPTTQEFRSPIEFEGSMRDPELVRRYQQYAQNMRGDQQRMAQNPMYPAATNMQMEADQAAMEMQAALQGRRLAPQMNDQMRMQQMPIGGFGQPDQASMQARINDLARRRADPYAMQMQMQADALQGRRQAPQMNDQMRMYQMRNDQMRQRQMMAQQRPYGGAFNPYGGYSRVGIGSLMPFMFRQGY